MHAGQDLDQGRFAGAVLPDESVRLPGVQLELSVAQRGDGTEVLRHTAQRRGRPAGGSVHLVSLARRMFRFDLPRSHMDRFNPV